LQAAPCHTARSPCHPPGLLLLLLLACLPALQGYAAEQDKRRLQAEVDKLTKRR
jgi:hypothetical protein